MADVMKHPMWTWWVIFERPFGISSKNRHLAGEGSGEMIVCAKDFEDAYQLAQTIENAHRTDPLQPCNRLVVVKRDRAIAAMNPGEKG